MSDGLKSKTLHGLFWSFSQSMGQQGIQFVIAIILARLLAPEQFGLLAMLAIFMAVAQTFINSGFGAALVQKKDATHVDSCSIFYFNILVRKTWETMSNADKNYSDFAERIGKLLTTVET